MMLRSVTATAIATAMLATSVTPAMAQGYPGYGYGGGYGGGYGHNYRHRDHNDTGAIIAGVAAVGILAAVLASSSNKNRNRYAINSESAAADACSNAVQRQSGGRVNIDQVYRSQGGYQVRGTMDGRGNGYGRNDYGQGFTCQVGYGGVQRVDIDTGRDYRGYRDDRNDRGY